MRISELLSNNGLDLRISSSTATNYKAELYWRDKFVELKRGYFVESLYGVGDTINEAVENLIAKIMQTHRIKVNKNRMKDSYYINVDNLYQ